MERLDAHVAAATGHHHQHVCPLGVGIVDHEVADRPTRGVRGSDQAHAVVSVLGARSVRHGEPRLAPSVKVRAAPRDRARAESHGARELVVGDEAVDRRAPRPVTRSTVGMRRNSGAASGSGKACSRELRCIDDLRSGLTRPL